MTAPALAQPLVVRVVFLGRSLSCNMLLSSLRAGLLMSPAGYLVSRYAEPSAAAAAVSAA